MGIYIPASKRDRLLKYKYSSTDLSLTSVRSGSTCEFGSGAVADHLGARALAEIHLDAVLEPTRLAVPEEHGAERNYALGEPSLSGLCTEPVRRGNVVSGSRGHDD